MIAALLLLLASPMAHAAPDLGALNELAQARIEAAAEAGGCPSEEGRATLDSAFAVAAAWALVVEGHPDPDAEAARACLAGHSGDVPLWLEACCPAPAPPRPTVRFRFGSSTWIEGPAPGRLTQDLSFGATVDDSGFVFHGDLRVQGSTWPTPDAPDRGAPKLAIDGRVGAGLRVGQGTPTTVALLAEIVASGSPATAAITPTTFHEHAVRGERFGLGPHVEARIRRQVGPRAVLRVAFDFEAHKRWRPSGGTVSLDPDGRPTNLSADDLVPDAAIVGGRIGIELGLERGAVGPWVGLWWPFEESLDYGGLGPVLPGDVPTVRVGFDVLLP